MYEAIKNKIYNPMGLETMNTIPTNTAPRAPVKDDAHESYLA